jgi:hypothetical protein
MRLDMTVTWVVATPFNVAGAPADNLLVDISLLRQYWAGSNDARILLPASTIKGKLRSEAERLLRTFGVGGRLCQGRTADTLCPAFWWDKEAPPYGDTCLLCCLFGSPWQPAALRFSNVFLGNVKSSETIVRPGIGLSRVRGTVQEDLLFFVETTPALIDGVTFAEGNIQGDVPDEQSAALLWAASQQVVAFGNGRSRGRGWLKEKEIRLQVDGETWDKKRIATVWRNWLR